MAATRKLLGYRRHKEYVFSYEDHRTLGMVFFFIFASYGLFNTPQGELGMQKSMQLQYVT